MIGVVFWSVFWRWVDDFYVMFLQFQEEIIIIKVLQGILLQSKKHNGRQSKKGNMLHQTKWLTCPLGQKPRLMASSLTSVQWKVAIPANNRIVELLNKGVFWLLWPETHTACIRSNFGYNRVPQTLSSHKWCSWTPHR